MDHPVPKPVTPVQGIDFDPFVIISSTFCAFYTPRAIQMAKELQACRGNLQAIRQVYDKYPDVHAAIRSLQTSQ